MASRISYINTKAALNEAHQFANRILYASQPSRRSSTSTIHRNHYHWGPSWGWHYFPQPIYCAPLPGRGGRYEKKDHSWVAIPAAIVALGTLYFVGQNHAEWSIATDELRDLRQANQAVRLELSHAHPAVKSTVLSVFQKQMAILEEIRKNAIAGLLLKGILLTSVILAGVGGLASGSILFTASLEPFFEYGCLSALLASAAMIYHTGFSSTDQSLQRKARDLEFTLARADQLLQ